jgi:DNA-binding response OmpR family regulator
MSAKTDRREWTETTDQSHTKVLLAEDDESFVDALVIGLSREGFDVTVARDGNEALRLFASEEPDLVLLDLMLPRLSGIDVCRSIRAQSSVPIIMVTAKGTEIDTVVGLEVGADDYVAKPYRLRELVARMRAVLRRTPGADTRESMTAPPGPRDRSATARIGGPAARSSRPAASRSTPIAISSSSAVKTCTCVARSSSCSPS